MLKANVQTSIPCENCIHKYICMHKEACKEKIEKAEKIDDTRFKIIVKCKHHMSATFHNVDGNYLRKVVSYDNNGKVR